MSIDFIRPEVMLWRRLRQRPGGFKFRRQHPAGRYVLDFFCSQARLAIEIDGISHDLPERADHDDARLRWLNTNDIQVYRIAAGDVTRDPDAVAEALVAACAARIPLHHSPATSGSTRHD